MPVGCWHCDEVQILHSLSNSNTKGEKKHQGILTKFSHAHVSMAIVQSRTPVAANQYKSYEGNNSEIGIQNTLNNNTPIPTVVVAPRAMRLESTNPSHDAFARKRHRCTENKGEGDPLTPRHIAHQGECSPVKLWFYCILNGCKLAWESMGGKAG